MNNDSPCRGCPDRVASCHSHCEPYRRYVQENEADRVLRQQESASYIPDVEFYKRIKQYQDARTNKKRRKKNG